MPQGSGLVSIIMPTYNRASRLEQTLEGCLRQTYNKLEVIVVDDGSTDETPSVVARAVRRWGTHRIRYVQQTHAGACAARNRGMDAARGEFVQFLDSDDFLEPDKILVQMRALHESRASFAICDFAYVRGAEPDVEILRTVPNDGNLRDKVAQFRGLCISTPLLRRSSIPAGLRWNTTLRRYQDVDFFFKYLLTGVSWTYTPGVLAYYVRHEDAQISDEYVRGVQAVGIATSAARFFVDERGSIPRQNYWMLLSFTYRIGRRFARSVIDRWRSGGTNEHE